MQHVRCECEYPACDHAAGACVREGEARDAGELVPALAGEIVWFCPDCWSGWRERERSQS